ncbi:hypothetical protein BDR26DRAFT_954926 [Obelidium mucronatum]|nr:hypothetical protein BDR26DRAFT_954926 [Obelidium mucronatum]
MIGQTCRNRALLELERRFCGNKTEDLEESTFLYSDRQLLATFLDIRTVKGPHLNAEMRKRGTVLFRDNYAAFAEQCAKFQFDKALRAAATPKLGSPNSSSGSKRLKTATGSIFSGFAYGKSSWSDEDNDTASQAHSEFESHQFVFNIPQAKDQAIEYLKNWRKLVIDWHKLFPDLPDDENLDLVHHLIYVNMGTVYIESLGQSEEFLVNPRNHQNHFLLHNALNKEN